MHDHKIVQIDPSVTKEQREDPRFQSLLQSYQEFFNDPRNDQYKLMLGLHEAGGHGYLARKAPSDFISKTAWSQFVEHSGNTLDVGQSLIASPLQMNR